MQRPILISPQTKQTIQRKRVAAYCRVSTSSSDQLNSYAAQINYYKRLFDKHEEWEKAGIFADEGISGTKSENRAEFQKLIQLCEMHRVDVIITKSVSRFARNVTEALHYVRKLKLLSVAVIFEKEGINTLSLGDEMLLNTFTAIAQEESESISQNVRLSIVKRMATGEYVDGNAPYGFRLNNKKLEAYEPEAQVVKWIFDSYLNGKSISEIASELTSNKIPTKQGTKEWRPYGISYILTNERYMGDCNYQKTYRSETVPFKQSKNRGQEDKFYAVDTHEGFISKDTFEKVKSLLNKRKEKFAKTKTQNIYPLTSRIRCSECGSFFHRKIRNGVIKWVCSRHESDFTACDSEYYREDRIYNGIITIINKLRFGPEDILSQIISKLEQASAAYKINNLNAYQINQNMAEINATILQLNKLHSKGYLAAEIYESEIRELKKKQNKLKLEKANEYESDFTKMLQETKALRERIFEITVPPETLDEKFTVEFIPQIEINNKSEMTVTFKGGLKFTETI